MTWFSGSRNFLSQPSPPELRWESLRGLICRTAHGTKTSGAPYRRNIPTPPENTPAPQSRPSTAPTA